MAHSYSNFADAFAHLCSRNDVYRYFIEDCYDKADAAKSYANAGNYKWGIRYNVYAIKALATALDEIVQGQYNEPDNSSFYESFYWASQEGGEAEEYELTAIKICEAWAKDGFEERALTIGFIDRMRQLIWDEPFFVKWAARPESG